MTIQRVLTAVAYGLIAAPALASQAPPDSSGPIATQAAVNTPPPPSAFATPTPADATAAALRAAVLPPKPASAPATPAAVPAAQAPVPAAPAASPIAMLPTATAAVPPAASAGVTPGSSVYGDPAALQPTALAPGLPVKDRTGAAIGQVTSVDDDPKNGQLVTVQMGEESFRLRADRFGLWGGAATINLTQADIEAQLHPAKKR